MFTCSGISAHAGSDFATKKRSTLLGAENFRRDVYYAGIAQKKIPYEEYNRDNHNCLDPYLFSDENPSAKLFDMAQ